MQMLEKTERYFAPAGRIIMGTFFVLSGFGKLMDIEGTAGYIEFIGFPAGTLLTIVAIVVEIGLGGALLIGYKAKLAALGLASFTLFITFPFHGPHMWSPEDPTQQIMFMKNIVIVGSLLFMAAHAGKFNVAPRSEHTTQTPTPAL